MVIAREEKSCETVTRDKGKVKELREMNSETSEIEAGKVI